MLLPDAVSSGAAPTAFPVPPPSHLAPSPRYLLFNPWCFNGLFLKTQPVYVSGNTTANQASIAAASIQYSDTGDNMVLSSNMPGFNISTSPSLLGLLPCSPQWGNGTQVCVVWGAAGLWGRERSGPKATLP